MCPRVPSLLLTSVCWFAYIVDCDVLNVPPKPPQSSGDVAFDTQTGQTCRTWDWVPAKTGKSDPNAEGVPEDKYGQLTPTCVELYRQYPSGTSARFALSRFSGEVAFDRQTGETCRTWNWIPSKLGKSDPNTGVAPEVKYGEYTPMCIELFNRYPSGTSPQPESIADETGEN